MRRAIWRALLRGQRHDSIGVALLLTGVDFAALIADKAFDNNTLRAMLNERGHRHYPREGRPKGVHPHEVEMYKWWHLVENFF